MMFEVSKGRGRPGSGWRTVQVALCAPNDSGLLSEKVLKFKALSTEKHKVSGLKLHTWNEQTKLVPYGHTAAIMQTSSTRNKTNQISYSAFLNTAHESSLKVCQCSQNCRTGRILGAAHWTCRWNSCRTSPQVTALRQCETDDTGW